MKDAPAKSGSACKRSCCWTPQGVCIQHGKCACHLPREVVDRNARDIALEQARLRKSRESSEANQIFTGMGADPWKR